MPWLTAVGWTGSGVIIWSLLQRGPLRLRTINLTGAAILASYNWALGVWPQVWLNAAVILVNLWFMRGIIARRRDAAKNQVPARAEDSTDAT